MLTNSDNDIAEALARQTAVADGRARRASPAAARPSRAQLKKLGLPLTGARLHDGSGLDRDDRLTAGLLTALLVKAGDPAHPDLRPVLTGLPVAGFTGTLHQPLHRTARHRRRPRQDRHPDRREHPGRARSSTRTAASSPSPSWPPDTTDPAAAQAALDRHGRGAGGLRLRLAPGDPADCSS